LDRGFVLTDYGQTKIFEIPSFKETGLVCHGFTTRLGGIGTKPYDTLNLALHVGDRPEAVIENRKTVCRILGADMANLVTARQVHGSRVEAVGPHHAGRGAFYYDSAMPETDGLITDRPELLLATFYADCVPIFILDPVRKVVGSIHAGWKGTVARIGARAVGKMTEVFGTRPADCLVGIGPSIGPCCYMVSDPVTGLIPGEFGSSTDILAPAENGKARLNLWEANRKVLVQAGVMEENVEISHICTCCNQQILFSYRADRGVTGRMGAFIMLKPEPPL